MDYRTRQRRCLQSWEGSKCDIFLTTHLPNVRYLCGFTGSSAGLGSKKKPVLVFPDIHLHVEHTRVDGFREWFEDFVIGGNNDDDKERDGSITYMDPMQTGPLAILNLFHVGIFRIADEPLPPKGPPRVQVDLYCERMELTSMGAASGTTEPTLKSVKS